ncbi:hypothetical protein B0H14DRAFT_2819054 [Mycena olivaceomarginata]|nr:hypothetical protein B0H14DRAFT_2819054 [Mycena olivaceomarginata]
MSGGPRERGQRRGQKNGPQALGAPPSGHFSTKASPEEIANQDATLEYCGFSSRGAEDEYAINFDGDIAVNQSEALDEVHWFTLSTRPPVNNPSLHRLPAAGKHSQKCPFILPAQACGKLSVVAGPLRTSFDGRADSETDLDADGLKIVEQTCKIPNQLDSLAEASESVQPFGGMLEVSPFPPFPQLSATDLPSNIFQPPPNLVDFNVPPAHSFFASNEEPRPSTSRDFGSGEANFKMRMNNGHSYSGGYPCPLGVYLTAAGCQPVSHSTSASQTTNGTQTRDSPYLQTLPTE